MTGQNAAMEPKTPATRSAFDVAFWLLERAFGAKSALSQRKLRLLLYVAQGQFAAHHEGRALMPACFVAETDGPDEPNLSLALNAGIAQPWHPELSGVAASFLDEFWLQYGALPLAALERLVAADGVWKAVLTDTPGSVITLERLAEGYKPRPKPVQTAPVEPAPKPVRQAPPAPTGNPAIVGFTGDGRTVTRWRPKRTVQEAAG